MGLKFKCPECGNSTVAFDVGLGETTLCQVCGKRTRVPTNAGEIEHVPDPVSESDLNNDKLRDEGKRVPWVTFVYWANLIINPIFGTMIIINHLVAPSYSVHAETSYAAIGVSLWCSVPFFIGLLCRRRWGVWGVAATWIVFIGLLLSYFAWGQVLYSFTAAFGFSFAVRSEWDYLR